MLTWQNYLRPNSDAPLTRCNSEMPVALVLMLALTLPPQSHHSIKELERTGRTCLYSRRAKTVEQFTG